MFFNIKFITYNITNNQWSDYITYINGCLSDITSLFFDYYEISNEYSLYYYLYQSSSKIYILKLDDLGIINKYNNDTYESVKNCDGYFFLL